MLVDMLQRRSIVILTDMALRDSLLTSKHCMALSPLGSSPLLSAHGTTLTTEKTKILDRWAEYFESVLNRPSIINDEVIDCIEQVDNNHEIDMSPQKSEVKKTINHLLSGKAPGADAISADVNKAGGTSTI